MALLTQEIGEDMCKIAATGANVENTCRWMQERKERLSGGGVHVRGGNGGLPANALRRILIRGYRTVMSSVDLSKVSIADLARGVEIAIVLRALLA